MQSGQSRQVQNGQELAMPAGSIMLQPLPQPSLVAISMKEGQRNETIDNIAAAKIKLKDNYKELYEKIYVSNQVSEIKKKIREIILIEQSKIPSACGYIASPCLKGTFVGGVLGASTGILAVTGATLLACLPLCCCASSAACVRHSAYAQSSSVDAQHSTCEEAARDKLIGFIESAASLVCDPRVAQWGGVVGASIGCVAGTAHGYCKYKKVNLESQIILDLLEKLYNAYSVAEQFTSNEDGLRKVMVSMSRDDIKAGASMVSVAVLEKRNLLDSVVNTQTSVGFFPPLVAKENDTTNLSSNDQKEIFDAKLKM